jgi:hypothetical protein
VDIVRVLKQAEAKLERELKGIRNAMFALASPSTRRKGKRRVSAASRKKMAAAAKARWAKRKKLTAAK